MSKIDISCYGNDYMLAFLNKTLNINRTLGVGLLSDHDFDKLPKSDLEWPEDLLPGNGNMFGYIEAYRIWAYYSETGKLGAAGCAYCEDRGIWEPKKVTRARIVGSDVPGIPGGLPGYHGVKKEEFVDKFGYNKDVFVFGKVALWGATVEHERGYRAEYAYPLQFLSAAHVTEENEFTIIQQLNKLYLLR